MSDMKYGVKDTSFPQQTRRDKSSNSLLKKTHDWSFMVRIPELGNCSMSEWRSNMDAKITREQLFPVTRKRKGNNTMTTDVHWLVAQLFKNAR